MTRFTPGPWGFVEGLNDYGAQDPSAPILGTITMGGTWHIAVVPSDLKEASANACLIAAAPELYDALRKLRSALSSGVQVTQSVIPEVDAALAKARGESVSA